MPLLIKATSFASRRSVTKSVKKSTLFSSKRQEKNLDIAFFYSQLATIDGAVCL